MQRLDQQHLQSTKTYTQRTSNMANDQQPDIKSVFEPKTGTWQYIVADPATKDAVIIDSVLDYDSATSTITTESANNLLSVVDSNNFNVVAILETHAHADHLTASRYLQQKLLRSGKPKASICIGKRIESVQHTFARKYGIDEAEYVGVFDKLLDDDELIPLGKLSIHVMHLPGHTPDHVGYKVGSNIFTGDSIFLPDVGTARCDFPGGDARALYRSMQKLLALPPDLRLYSGHDYPPKDRIEGPQPFATVADEKARNLHVHDGVTEEQFVEWRHKRDETLAEPKLIHQALQFNIRAGQLPRTNDHGHRFVHVPLKVPEEEWTWGNAPQG
ncbi:Metallo-hydrolase/oxidoreductase [Amniculicola lignicola CBS 123094]|uniref:Metallo-hydrolase/oxidoreductase n=1 Tax=Amniculicola lignicola CBS 123094 TaxID=1392246 RepID=A0A6A5X271_9PLEO|nr:Metallo-hydrolase/oxidoreductase [Amniculicola lignicola CBS 123094]